MIGSVNSSAYDVQGMSAMGGMGPMQGPPPGPPPSDPVEELESAYDSGEVDTEELSAKLIEVFGEEAASEVVGEDGTVDFEALTNIIAAERTEEMTADLTEKFGEDAAQFVSDTGEIDHEGLKAYLAESGIEPPEGPPPGGRGGEPTGYGPDGEGTNNDDALSFLSMFA